MNIRPMIATKWLPYGSLIYCAIKAGFINRLVGQCISCWLLGCWANMNMSKKETLLPSSDSYFTRIAISYETSSTAKPFREVGQAEAEHSIRGSFSEDSMCIRYSLDALCSISILFHSMYHVKPKSFTHLSINRFTNIKPVPSSITSHAGMCSY